MLEPWQAEELAHGRPEYDATEIKEGPFGVDETIEFIEGRQAEAEQWIAANEPPAEGGEEPGEGEEPEGEEPGGGEGSGGNEVPVKDVSSSGGAGSSPLKPVAAPGSVAIGRLALARGVLGTRLNLSGPGMVTEWVTMHTAAGRRNVCTVTRTVVALTAKMRCGLSRAARRRLVGHRVPLVIQISFVPQDGGATATLSKRFSAREGSPRPH